MVMKTKAHASAKLVIESHATRRGNAWSKAMKVDHAPLRGYEGPRRGPDCDVEVYIALA